MSVSSVFGLERKNEEENRRSTRLIITAKDVLNQLQGIPDNSVSLLTNTSSTRLPLENGLKVPWSATYGRLARADGRH